MVYDNGFRAWRREFVPTLRMKAARRGVEEYEYLFLLDSLSGDSTKSGAIVDRLVRRPLGPKSVGNINTWSHDPEEFDKARDEMADMIEKLIAQ